jgi:hypothetical protein
MKAAITRAGVWLLAACWFSVAALGADPARVHVDATSVGPRPLEKETQASVVRDYLEAWQALSKGLAQNRTDVLDPSFVGLAQQQLADTVEAQRKAGLQTLYHDLSHDISLTFYSPEGLSIELVDNIEYEVQVLEHGQVRGTERVRTRYVSILTPTEVRWKVRIFQATPE